MKWSQFQKLPNANQLLATYIYIKKKKQKLKTSVISLIPSLKANPIRSSSEPPQKENKKKKKTNYYYPFQYVFFVDGWVMFKTPMSFRHHLIQLRGSHISYYRTTRENRRCTKSCLVNHPYSLWNVMTGLYIYIFVRAF